MKFASAVVAFATMSVASGAICEMDSPIAEGMEQVSGTVTVLVVLDSQNSDTNPVLLTRLVCFLFLSKVFFNGGWPTGPVGSIQEIIADAADAEASGAPIVDGKSGNTDFPHGDLKALTVSQKVLGQV